MLSKIRVQNFKAFKDTGDIELKPITILMGANSSGKTSILQALLVLRQTLESREIDVPLHVVGDYVDLGSYVDCVFQHKIAEKHQNFLSFSFTIIPSVIPRLSSSLSRLTSQMYRLVSKKINVQRFNVQVSFGYNKRARRIYLRNFELRDGNELMVLRASYTASGQVTEVKSEAFSGDFSSPLFSRAFSKNLRQRKFFYEYRQRQRLPMIELRDRSFAEERQIAAFLSNCYDQTERALLQVFYLGPLRTRTLRFNPITGETPQDVGFDGESVLKVLYKDMKASKKQTKNLNERVTSWMKRFHVASEIKFVTLAGNYFAVNVTDPHNNAIVNLSDVGFGVSQILPVIVEGFYAPRNSTILVEQPEIHLHPALQSELGDLLIEIVSEKKRVIVETHSEHLLLRLQKRVAEDRLDPNDVAIYFIKPGKEGSTVDTVTLNSLGQWSGWPEGFFEEDIRERVDFVKTISEKMQKSSKS